MSGFLLALLLVLAFGALDWEFPWWVWVAALMGPLFTSTIQAIIAWILNFFKKEVKNGNFQIKRP